MIGMTLLLVGVAGGLIGLILLIYSYRKIHATNILIENAKEKLKNIKRAIENERKEALLKLKDELYHKRKEFDLELKKERIELERFQSKLNTKYDQLEERSQKIEDTTREIQGKERNLNRLEDAMRIHETKLKELYQDLIVKLEHASNMSKDEAKAVLFETIQDEVNLASQKFIQKVEEDAKNTSKQKAVDVIVTAMQRYTADSVSAHSSAIIHLPTDEMKGRIIGKEGRNIKALEMATGMEFVIGDTPDITISGFNPIRREVAKRTLERLVVDGRINPTRIEEMVAQCEKEIDETIQEFGKETILEYNLQGVHPEIITLLGKLYFRTSFSQNVLQHSKEVGVFARLIAEELGLDGQLALRCGLFHDIGKAVTAEVEGPHAKIGGDIAKRCGEDAIVVNAISAHHEEVAPTSVYGWITIIADTMSACRPGARRETLSAYIKRLEKLEEIAHKFDGVKRAYALQAGREVRIIVQEDEVSDEKSLELARAIAREIEKEMNFPGQIKVNVIRETRAIEYAR
jgi:ribonuclease Y